MKHFNIKNLNKNQRKLRARILEISYKRQLSHLGSCLSAVDAIDVIYRIKNTKDKFVLSNGHAGVAWYAVLEKNKLLKPRLIDRLNIHPDRTEKHGIHVSTGSLGQGLPIALGMAFANKKVNIYCMVSDGEMTEGSIWEALRIIKEYKIDNLKVIINANGWSAYNTVNLSRLAKQLKGFGFSVNKVNGHSIDEIKRGLKSRFKKTLEILFLLTNSEQLPFLKGQDAHYYVMNEKDYKNGLKILE